MPKPDTSSLNAARGSQLVISCRNRKQLQVSPLLDMMKQEKARVVENGIVDGDRSKMKYDVPAEYVD